MERPSKSYILSHECVGFLEINRLAVGLPLKEIPTQAFKGELFEVLPKAKQPRDSTRVALTGIDRKSLRLECSKKDIIPFSRRVDIPLWFPRLQNETSGKYRQDFERRVSSGIQVCDAMESDSKSLPGVLSYSGDQPPTSGAMFGAELMENQDLGSSSGTVGNFPCASDPGACFELEKSTPQEQTDNKPEIGQRVVTFINDVLVSGTVRYIGDERDSRGHVHTIVGLELDAKRGNGNGKRNGKRLFVCKRNCAAFVDIETIITKNDLDSNENPRKYPTEEENHDSEVIAESLSFDHGKTSENSREEELNHSQEQLIKKEEHEANLIQQFTTIEEQNENLQKKLMKIEKELTNCQEQLWYKGEHLNYLQDQLSEKGQELENCRGQLSKKEEQSNFLREQLREKEEHENHLMHQLTQTEETKVNLQTELVAMKQELTTCKEQLWEKEEQLRKTEKQNDNLSRQLTEREGQAANLQAQLNEQELQLTNIQIETAFLDEKARAKLQEVANLEKQLRDQEQDMAELQTALSTANETLRKYESQLKQRDWVISRDEIQITEKCLGEGGWGRVVEGRYCDCAVAVKHLHKSTLTPKERTLFEREMDIASRCRHPCLLQFIGATQDASPMFITELMESSLRTLLGHRKLSETEISVISLDVARALNYLHQRKPIPIVHRDVSSANVLLWRQRDQWRAKVSDYGTAKFVQEIMTVAPGALIYSAPEAGSPYNQTVKIDVYSFGVLLCEMCIDELPDPDKRNKQVAKVENRECQKLILWCLEEDAEMRPDMAEVIEELEHLNVTLSADKEKLE